MIWEKEQYKSYLEKASEQSFLVFFQLLRQVTLYAVGHSKRQSERRVILLPD